MAAPLAVPTLTDGVVTLRAHRPGDAQRSYEQCVDPVSQTWTTVPVPYSLADAEQFVGEVMPGGWEANSEWAFAIEVDGAYGGTVSLRNEGQGRAEIAYGSHPAIRGTGAVERALRLLLDWGFEAMELETVVWWANRGNWASRKVAWRLGFGFGGSIERWLPQRGELLDAWVGWLGRDDPRTPRTTWLDCPVLEGDEVRLRPFVQADVPRIVESRRDPEVRQWLGADAAFPYGPADAHRWLERLQEARATGAGVVWAISHPDDPQTALGALNLMHLEPGHQVEVGFWLHPDARGRGVATRATRVGVRHAFDGWGVGRVEGQASVDNGASQRVLERGGLTRYGVRRAADRRGDGTVGDLVGFDLTTAEFHALAGA